MKRITIITGHYGSGKTEFSLNLALEKHVDVVIDLDIVNPYFRSREATEFLATKGIKVIGSTMENASGSDLPYVSSQMYLPFRNDSVSSIIDLGGNDVGATLVRQFVQEIQVPQVDFLSVVNIYRPETATAKDIVSMVRLIEGKSGLKVTGLVNNSNLLHLTTHEDVIHSFAIVKDAADSLGIPIVYTSIIASLLPLDNPYGELIPLHLYLRKAWMR